MSSIQESFKAGQAKAEQMMESGRNAASTATQSAQEGTEKASGFLHQTGEQATSMAQGAVETVKNTLGRDNSSGNTPGSKVGGLPWVSRSDYRRRRGLRLHVCRVARTGRLADVGHEKATAFSVAFRAQQALFGRGRSFRVDFERFDVLVSFLVWSRREDVLRSGGNVGVSPFFAFFMKEGRFYPVLRREELLRLFGAIWRFSGVLVALSTRGRHEEWGKRRAMLGFCVLREVGSPRFCVSQARECARGLSRCSGTVEVLSSSWTPSLSGRVVVRLRERRQWDSDLLWWFGWSPQFFGFTYVVELQLDFTSVTARLRVVVLLADVCHGVGTVVVEVGGEVEVMCLGDQLLLRWCACETCGLGFMVIEWINGVVVSSSFRGLALVSLEEVL
ncbi:hypothetical protein Taro_042692 [Colocasia esculenta]|uniref:Uncharacterized protein n=1 Tax=Colocasia esculenta TaxID=4460 RepID=A0A843WPJ9_COLES|nr:hypothetical protein [Colocasia esculenta]